MTESSHTEHDQLARRGDAHNVAVVDYGLGNSGSILNMLAKLGVAAIATSDADLLRNAAKLILPGVGAFDVAMARLAELHLVDVLNALVCDEKKPVLGLCLGMQLFCGRSEEGSRPGLGWIDANAVRFRFSSAERDLKVPHMGWNSVCATPGSTLFREMQEEPRFYFVHSYHVVCRQRSDVAATSRHGTEFTAAVERGNIMGTQFHPEKSHRFGMKILENFIRFS